MLCGREFRCSVGLRQRLSPAVAGTDYVINITGQIDPKTELLALNLPSNVTLTIEGTDGFGRAETIDGMGAPIGLRGLEVRRAKKAAC